MSEVFLTGGTGFIGGVLLGELIDRGRSVTALCRDRTGQQIVEAAGAVGHLGDMMELDTLVDGMRGASVVYHVAGVNELCSRRPDHMYRVNVHGSVNVIEAAAAAGVRRVIYTSSAATLGERRGEVGTADTVHRGSYLTAYERSKHHAEQAVLRRGADLGVEVVSVNPSSVQGPGRTQGTAKVLIGFLDGSLKVSVDARFSLVFIDDCIAAHLAAESNGLPGRRYVISGTTLTLRHALDLLSLATGVKRRILFVPMPVLQVVGPVAGWLAQALRRDVPICREAVRALAHGHAYQGEAAGEQLGITYTPIAEALARTVDWYRSVGLVDE